MIERVRAMLLTPADGLLLIRRTRPGAAPYWVFPGGHVEPEDPDLRSALMRELREETGAEPHITGLLHVLADERERQYFYLGRIEAWSEADRTGPEFGDPDRGEYRLEEVPLTREALAARDIMPEPVAAFLYDAVTSETDLASLADPTR